jgi:hypothetical protein
MFSGITHHKKTDTLCEENYSELWDRLFRDLHTVCTIYGLMHSVSVIQHFKVYVSNHHSCHHRHCSLVTIVDWIITVSAIYTHAHIFLLSVTVIVYQFAVLYKLKYLSLNATKQVLSYQNSVKQIFPSWNILGPVTMEYIYVGYNIQGIPI